MQHLAAVVLFQVGWQVLNVYTPISSKHMAVTQPI
jgi:hypothetical protein